MDKLTDDIPLLIILGMAGTCLLVVSFILLHIYNQNQILHQKRKLHEAEMSYQKELLKTIITSEEKERKRIGMDLHDEVGSALSSLRMSIDSFVEKHKTIEELHDFSRQCKSSIDSVITNVRNISHNLSPLTSGQHAFTDALEDLCDAINKTGSLKVLLQNKANNQLMQLNNTSALALYRVISELINNTIKHAQAKNIVLSFNAENNGLKINYKDDGRGLTNTQEKHGMGMRNIESRLGIIGAAYLIEPNTQKGFEVNIKMNI